ncbi:MAG: DNA-binding protein [Azoarcus sp.]|nr:DNA-binding protein [Azoarcus sp.]
MFEVATPEEVFARLKAAAVAGIPDAEAHMSFPSPADMARVMTPTRWGIVAAMTGAGPLGVRELARRVGRDVKGVHTDAQALASAGVIDRTDDSKYLFPYDAVRVSFELRAAA